MKISTKGIYALEIITDLALHTCLLYTSLPDGAKWGPEKCDADYRDKNRINCYDTGTAPCKTACPAHIAVQGYLKKAAQGKYRDCLLYTSLLNQCVEIYISKGIQDGISHLSLFSYHLILIFFTEGIRNYPSACRNYSKNGIDPNSCPIAGRC